MSYKILIIDDSDFIVQGTSDLLRFEDYEVYSASDGSSGLLLLEEVRPDVVLCDVSMPTMSGFEVLDEIRANPTIATTGFIFLTAHADKDDLRRGMESGADDYIMKPFSRKEILSAIEAVIKKRFAHQKSVEDKLERLGLTITFALPHEFRTALNEIRGTASLLKAGASDISANEVSESAGDILTSVQRLVKISENFIVYSQIQKLENDLSAREKLRKHSVEHAISIVQDLAETVAMRYSRGDEIQFESDWDDVSLQISGESFHKIVEEILDNAFKFSQAGSRVSVRAFTIDKQFYLTIIDRGRGMTDEQIAAIAALTQFDRNINEQQGIGLGLVIAKKIVELHDGSFLIQRLQEGATSVVIALNAL